ncbi:microtubule-associated protein futsch [Diachasma alloeum]|uniref:microtubule-associated protein futsch n=1 Tax=Diachasma alloeum TaxID=454923 RepID=UPI000738241D|nr:microtubule-associated protein futsch [Diachasma alloeum]
MGIKKSGKKKIMKDGTEAVTTSTEVSGETTVTSSRIVAEASTSAETASRSSTKEITSGSREVIMDSRGNIIKVTETPGATIRQGKSSVKGATASEDFIQGEQSQMIEKPRPEVRHKIASDAMQRENVGCDTFMTSSSVVSSSSFTEESSSASVGNNPPEVHRKSTESSQSAKTVSEGISRNGQLCTDTVRIDESENRLNIDGNVVATSGKNVQTESTVEPSGKPHVTFTDDKKTTKCVPLSKPGQSTWDGRFTYERPATPGRTTPAPAKTSKLTRHQEDLRTSSEQSSSFEEVKTSSEVTSIDKSSHDHVARPSRPGDFLDGSFVIDKSNKSCEMTKRTNEPTKIQTSGRTDVEIRDVSEERNIVESTSSSYIVEYKDSSDGRRVERVSTVSTTIQEEEPSSPRGASTPVRPGSADKRHFKPGESTWDGSFTLEKPPMSSTPRAADRRHRRTNVDIRDVTDDNTINEADVSTSSYIVETSASESSFSDVRDSSTIRRDEHVRRSSPTPGGSRPPGAAEIVNDSIIVEQSRVRESYSDSSNIDLSTTAVETVIIVDGKPVSRSVDYKVGSSGLRDTVIRDADGRSGRPCKSVGRDALPGDAVGQTGLTESLTDSVDVSSSRRFISVESTSTADSKTYEVLESDVKNGRRPQSPERITGRSPSPGDRASRPTKPGSSTWDGSFTYEKPQQPKKPADTLKDVLQHPKDIKRPEPITDRRTDKTGVSTTKFINVESTSTIDSKVFDSSDVSTTVFHDVRDIRRPQSPEKITGRPSDKRSPSPGDRSSRPTKPGSSTWDGSFTYEKPQQPKKPADTLKDVLQHPKDVKRPDQRSGSITDRTTDKTDVSTTKFINVESTSTIDSKVFDSSDVSTTVFHDVRDTRRPQSPEKITGRPSSPEKRSPSPGDRASRPTKPGSSTWDGSFTYEKPQQPKKPADTLKDVLQYPKDIKRPESITDRRTDKIDVSTTKFINVESTSTIDSKVFDSSDVSTTVFHDTRDTRRPQSPEKITGRPSSPEKRSPSPGDRVCRPTKPGSSTWDGSFTYEKPQQPKKPADTLKDIIQHPKDVSKRPEQRPVPITDRKTEKTEYSTTVSKSINVESTLAEDSQTFDSRSYSKP